MTRFTLPVTLKVRGATITRSSSIGAVGIDASMAKRKFGATGERYYLPGRLVKGLLREAWQELGTVKPEYAGYITEWLGAGSGEDYNEPLRGRLYFSDFADDKPATARLRYRISIEEDTGVADAGMLQVTESPYAPLQEVEFSGEVRCLTGAGENVQPVLEAVQRGLLWVRAVGGARTSGFGELRDVVCGAPEQPAKKPAVAPEQDSVWEYRISFSEPVILSKRRISDNLFESGDVIPGGALKGAVADMIRREPLAYQQLLDELHAVRFTHGFPTKDGKRPQWRPLSVMLTDQGKLVNALDVEDNLDGSFDIDWKDQEKEKANAEYPWPEVPWELRVRTAIDSKLRKTDEGALFAWQMLDPTDFQWVGQVETSRISDAARAQLRDLLSFGVEPIGKTKALGTVDLFEPRRAGARAYPTYTVTLETPCLLIDPGNSLTSAEDLQAEYGRVWRELSDGSLRLIGNKYFQRCSLAGGEYYWRRFSRQRGKYWPYLLTDAGSTFRLQVEAGKEAQAGEYLGRWLTHGLPISPWVLRFYGIPPDLKNMWQHCPYLPENGYGEIHVGEFHV